MWLLNNKEFKSEDIGDYIGFVYIITCIQTGKKYLGKKNFFSRTKLNPLKGKKRKRLVIKESDWMEYYGSNEELKNLSENNETAFKREIIHLCKSKGEMSYIEAKKQFEYDVLLHDEYFNSFIGCKIHRNHVKNMIDIK